MKDQKIFNDTLENIQKDQVSNPLDLYYQKLTENDILFLTRALANNHAITNLNLRGNNIDAKGVIPLAKNCSLTELNLGENQIGAEGARALANNRSLSWLSLSGNNIRSEGAKAFAKNHFLISLNLWDNNIAEGGSAFANNGSLTELNIGKNHIGAEVAIALANNRFLTTLNLWGNKILAEGARALVSNHSITSLDLSFNNIGDAAQEAINEMLVRNRNNAQNFLKASHEGNLKLMQTMLAENKVSPYCCVRSYTSENHSDPKKTDSQHTALHLAVIEAHHDIVRCLVKNYPQLLRMVDNDKKTPLMLAKEKNDTTMSAILSGKKEEQYTVRYTFSPDKEMHQNSLKQLAVFEGDSSHHLKTYLYMGAGYAVKITKASRVMCR